MPQINDIPFNNEANGEVHLFKIIALSDAGHCLLPRECSILF
jgi:hypothetical protein